MKFKPCIDIHNGQVKQIVGGTLRDDAVDTYINFSTSTPASDFAQLYKKDGLTGGHIIILNRVGTTEYDASCQQALAALRAYPGGMQIGGGITADNAKGFLDEGASHVIVTSYVFKNGTVDHVNLQRLTSAIGKKRIVLDLSCRKKEEDYFIVTDRWQHFTDVKVTPETLDFFADYCDEFLIHAVDAEGKQAGIERRLAKTLGEWGKITVTYAGGVGSYDDLRLLHKIGNGKLDVTVGSALDIFGGSLNYEKIVEMCQ